MYSCRCILGSTLVDPLIAPSIPVTIPVSGMLPTWVDERDSSDEVEVVTSQWRGSPEKVSENHPRGV